MRLSRLDLVRYGRFTDRRLDFGPAPSGRPDLHLVYGPNEAGKSTMLSAILDVLFGIEAKTRYGFLHPPGTMRIGARLDIDGGTQDVLRLWRPQVLLDDRERPLPEGLFQAGLAGLDRTSYRSMFSLDDETLEAGGDAIIASDGELGQLLFSATAGLAGLSKALGLVRANAEAFYKPRGHGHGLAEAKKRLTALKTRKEEIDTLASAYGRLVAARDVAEDVYDAAVAERGRLQASLDGMRRHLDALPRVRELAAAKMRLECLGERRSVPAGWAQTLPLLQANEIELETRLATIEDEIARIAADIAGIVADPEATAAAPSMARLADARARYATAAQDLPDRRLQLAECEGEVNRLIRLLGRSGPAADLSIPVAAVGGLRALIEARSGIDTMLNEARAELEAASRRRTALAEDVPGDGADARIDGTRLADALAVASRSDHEARRRLAERALKSTRIVLAERMDRLRPWSGDAQALARLSPPSTGDIERLQTGTAAAADHVERTVAECATLASDIARLVDEIAATDEATGTIDDEAAAAARAGRDAAWLAHRTTLDALSATSFEWALAADDAMGIARMTHAGDVLALRVAKRTLALKRREHARAEARLSEAERGSDEAATRARAGRIACAHELAELDARSFVKWCGDRIRALEAYADVQAAEADMQSALDDGDALRSEIMAALAAAGAAKSEAGLADLLSDARSLLQRNEADRLARDRVAEAVREVAARADRLRTAEEAAAIWTEAWREACGSCWIGDGGVPEVSTVREILLHLGELGPAAQRRDALAYRISRMEADQTEFGREVAAIAAALGMQGRDAVALADAMGERIRAAAVAGVRHAARSTDCLEAEARRDDVRVAWAALLRRKSEMTSWFGVETLAEAAVSMQACREGAELVDRIAGLETQIVEAAGTGDIEAALGIMADVDRGSMEVRVGELRPRCDDQDQRVRELFHARGKAHDALDAVGGDDAPARLEEERRTVLLEIEEGAVSYMTLRAGVAAAEEALRLYREKHRSSMMQRASDAFATISGGAYEGLAVQVAKEAERLVGLVRGGGSKAAREMSKGTRFQLYLALRVAGYHEFVRARGPVPFVADDIMETFDDTRAEHAFALLADMARSGQVVYLTHHRHLCDVARRAYPGVFVHDLAEPSGHVVEDIGSRVA